MVKIPRFSLNNKAKEKVFSFYNHLNFYPLPKNFNENIESILLPLKICALPSRATQWAGLDS